jgi:hypothetical protein
MGFGLLRFELLQLLVYLDKVVAGSTIFCYVPLPPAFVTRM